jgi:hypothetical protein
MRPLLPALAGCALVFTIAWGILSGCNSPDDTDVYQAPDGTLRLGSAVVADTMRRATALAGRTLVLTGVRGSVTLRGTDASVATLRFVKQGRGPSRAEARSVLRGIRITESGTPEQFTYTAEISAPDRSAVSVVGTVPRTTPLRIEGARGSVVLDRLEGALTVRHPFGAVRIEGARGPVDVDIESGDLTASFRALPAEAPTRLATSNGNIAVALPSSASVQIQAETKVGRVQTRGLALTNQRLNPTGAGARYTAQHGDGRAMLNLETGNGRIVLRRMMGTGFESLVESRVPDTLNAAPDTSRLDSVPTETARPDSARAARPDTVGASGASAAPDRPRSDPPLDTARTGEP